MNEVKILSKLDNMNIIKFIELLRTENNYYLVYEYANGGDLDEFRKKQ
jgi:serine/threonine protein kinase